MKQLIISLLFLSANIFSQNAITLDSCIRMAKTNYPLIKQNNLLNETAVNNIKGINQNWLPRLSFTSQASDQSESTELHSPGFNVVAPKQLFTNSLDLDQTLFDGGQIKQQRRVEKLNAANEVEKNEVELYKLIDRVNQLYSNILLSRENIKALNIYKNDIINKKTIVAASFKNGMSLQSSLEELEAEELKTEQNLIEAKDDLLALYQSLGMFVNKTVDDNTDLSTQPIGTALQGNDITRPEMKLFTTQKDLLDARHKLNNTAAFPKVSLFADGAYGRTGYNFLNLDPRFYGMAGVRLRWNITTLYGLNKEKQSVAINSKMVDVQKEIFEFNLKSTLVAQTAKINSLKDIIETDKQILEKRHNIKHTAATQLENGSITTTDYLIQLNAEMQAILNQKIHEIRLMNAITNYNTSKGINNF